MDILQPITPATQSASTPMFNVAKDTVPILKSQEQDLKSKIPSVLGLKLPSPSKDLEAAVTTNDPTFLKKARNSYQSLQTFAENVPKYSEMFSGGKIDPQTKPDAPIYAFRNNSVSNNDLDEAKAILFGEISNRPSDKQMLEARTILGTAFNRMQAYRARGKDVSLTDVLQMPNQYQAYGGKEYNRFKSGQTQETDKRKIDSIDSVLNQIKDGSFHPSVDDNVFFYTHLPDGRINATDKPLFK